MISSVWYTISHAGVYTTAGSSEHRYQVLTNQFSAGLIPVSALFLIFFLFQGGSGGNLLGTLIMLGISGLALCLTAATMCWVHAWPLPLGVPW